jgi:N-acetylmuramic acid 6-phosphate etherase
MQLSNNKLIDRGTRMVMDGLSVSYEVANEMLRHYGSVRRAIEAGHTL